MTALRALSFQRSVGIHGYLFVLGLTLFGVSASAIVVEIPLTSTLGFGPAHRDWREGARRARRPGR